MSVQTSSVFEAMQDDLNLVRERLANAARLDFPVVSHLVDDIIQTGGKSFRPLLLLLAGKAFTYDRPRLVTAAAGVELLHIASLVHDDIIDRAAIRRGQPTLNSQMSSGSVVLIGDFLFAQSAILAAATDSTRVVSIFASTLGHICDGQLREMLTAHNVQQDRQDYFERIFGKTASLFAGAAEMGAVLGGATEDQVQALHGFGSDLGMAYQIIDDVLDIRGQTSDLGKPAGNDLRQGVVTLPAMIHVAGLQPGSPELDRLEQVVAGEETSDDAIDDVLHHLRRSGALEEASQVAERYLQSAREHLSAVPDREVRDWLDELLDLAIERNA